MLLHVLVHVDSRLAFYLVCESVRRNFCTYLRVKYAQINFLVHYIKTSQRTVLTLRKLVLFFDRQTPLGSRTQPPSELCRGFLGSIWQEIVFN